MKKILEVFTGPNGETSSKRVMGIALIITGIVGAFTGMDNVAIGILTGAGLGVFGVTAVTRT